MDVGSTCELKCSEDFTQTGEETIVCDYSGDWKGQFGECKKEKGIKTIIRSQSKMRCTLGFQDYRKHDRYRKIAQILIYHSKTLKNWIKRF